MCKTQVLAGTVSKDPSSPSLQMVTAPLVLKALFIHTCTSVLCHFLLKGQSSLDQGPALMTSFNFSYLLRSCLQIQSHWERRHIYIHNPYCVPTKRKKAFQINQEFSVKHNASRHRTYGGMAQQVSPSLISVQCSGYSTGRANHSLVSPEVETQMGI